MGYVKAVYMIGVPHGGTKSIKWNNHVLKCGSVWFKRQIACFSTIIFMILMHFLHIKVGLNN